MADPFEALRRPLGSTDPSPEFRAQVLADLRRVAAAHQRGADSDDQASGNPRRDEPPAPELIDVEVDMIGTHLSPRRTSIRRNGLIAAGLAAAVVLAIVAVVATRGSDSATVDVVGDQKAGSTTTASPAPSAPAVNEAALPPIQPFDAGFELFPTAQFASSVAIDGTTVWVSHDSGPIDRYDLSTGALLGTVPIPNGSLAPRPAFGFGSMWVATDLDDTLRRVDGRTGEILASIEIDGDIRGYDYVGASTAATSEDAVWVVSFDAAGSKLYRVDPATNTVSGSIPAPLSANNVVYADGSLWVQQVDGPLVRLDPADGRELASFPMAPYNTLMRLGFGSLWINDIVDDVDVIKRIDPATNTVVATIPIGGVSATYSRGDFAFSADSAWTSSADAVLVKIDPETDQVVARYGEKSGGAGLAATDDAVWFSVWSATELRRLSLS